MTGLAKFIGRAAAVAVPIALGALTIAWSDTLKQEPAGKEQRGEGSQLLAEDLTDVVPNTLPQAAALRPSSPRGRPDQVLPNHGSVA